eukprot:scaffold1752_cov197-Alexandrium_tamarense.AAC.10
MDVWSTSIAMLLFNYRYRDRVFTIYHRIMRRMLAVVVLTTTTDGRRQHIARLPIVLAEPSSSPQDDKPRAFVSAQEMNTSKKQS